jgi:hypothetical protein
MVQQVFDVESAVGELQAPQDTRVPVEDRSQLIAEEQQLRQAQTDAQTKIANTQALASIATSLTDIGFKMHEDAVVRDLLGSAATEGDAIDILTEQGEVMEGAVDNLTELAQQRSAGVLSFSEANREMRRIIRAARNNAPYYKGAIDRAVSKFLGEGSTALGMSGSLTQLSPAEKTVLNFNMKVLETSQLLRVPEERARDILQEDAINARERNRLTLEATRATATREETDALFFQQGQVIVNELRANLTNSMIMQIDSAGGETGLSSQDQASLKRQITTWEANQLAQLTTDIGTIQDPNKIPSPEIIRRMEQEISGIADSVAALVDDEDRLQFLEDHKNELAYRDEIWLRTNARGLMLAKQVSEDAANVMLFSAGDAFDDLKALAQTSPLLSQLMQMNHTGPWSTALDNSLITMSDSGADVSPQSVKGTNEVMKVLKQGSTDFADMLDAFVSAERVMEVAEADPDANVIYMTRDVADKAKEDVDYRNKVVIPFMSGQANATVKSIRAANNGGTLPGDATYRILTLKKHDEKNPVDNVIKLYPRLSINGSGINNKQKRFASELFNSIIMNIEALYPSAAGDPALQLKLAEEYLLLNLPGVFAGGGIQPLPSMKLE